jgi:SAM-dependent methyltransferase
MTDTAPNFDRVARLYQVLEYLTLGRSLESTRLHFLPRLLTTLNALVLGDGDGRFLAQLLAANPTLCATAIDTSAEMLALLRARCAPYADRLHTVNTDALAFTRDSAERYDLFVSHFFLDCLTQEQLDQLVQRTAPALSPGALWLISDFRIPAGVLRLPARLCVSGLYLAFSILTGLQVRRLPNHGATLTAAGFTRIVRREFLGGLLFTELWQTGPQSDTV